MASSRTRGKRGRVGVTSETIIPGGAGMICFKSYYLNSFLKFYSRDLLPTKAPLSQLFPASSRNALGMAKDHQKTPKAEAAPGDTRAEPLHPLFVIQVLRCLQL